MDNKRNRTAGSNLGCGFQALRIAAPAVTLNGWQSNPSVNIASTNADIRADTAFGIPRWLKVMDFDPFFGFLFLVFHFRFLLLGRLLFGLRQ